MKYVLLLANSAEDAATWAALGPEEARRVREAEIPRWNSALAYMQERGQLLAGLELDIATAARTVRARDGEAIVTDGPYAETKEQLGGYFLVDCDGLDEAIELARRIPVAATGSVEIRPLGTGEEAA